MVYSKRKAIQTGWTETGRKDTAQRIINALITLSQRSINNMPIRSASTDNEASTYHAHMVTFEQGSNLAIVATHHNAYR